MSLANSHPLLAVGILGAIAAMLNASLTPLPATPDPTQESPKGLLNSTLGVVDANRGLIPFSPTGYLADHGGAIEQDPMTSVDPLQTAPMVMVNSNLRMVGNSPEQLPTGFRIFIYRQGETDMGSPAQIVRCAGQDLISINGNVNPCRYHTSSEEPARWHYDLSVSEFCEGRQRETFTVVVETYWYPPADSLASATTPVPYTFFSQWWSLPVTMC